MSVLPEELVQLGLIVNHDHKPDRLGMVLPLLIAFAVLALALASQSRRMDVLEAQLAELEAPK